ncbi:MAG TPA: flagellar hook-basal body complex protein FliE [Cyanobacteria bacterium UBA11991]|nr:flagellar hook-basal body complex protein FliE [Cyanobacteriota bacterium]MDY6358524.1 flagellar hook-basal body complex protein FliE [Cyanobacteriota bacterium]MDY6364204.1 flagellar hook-basal body complex protein FliE [Cyanobacteriota bacterium]MDY6383655.1 flagellar hook-basal body complex protein FliE [Cyanobacteriota bacterium]HCB11772.1 flagellar hook-basal body complex protein FliE [Cyanobacteria bacterium UBA11991]
MTGYFPNYDLAGRIQHTKFASGFNMPSIRMDRVEKPETQDFKQVFSGLVENFNQDLNAPDDLLKDVMQGNKNVDIHDVMVAMSKTEISVNIATQMVGKVINAYDRVMQINI